MTRQLATHLLTATFAAVIALSLVAFGSISIGAVSAQSGANLGCVDSNGNGVVDISELFDVIDAYFDGTEVSPTPTTVDFSGGGPNRYRFIILTPGDNTWAITHDGSSTFRLELTDDKDYSRVLVDVTGEYSDTVHFRVGDDAPGEFSPGRYASLRITADGSWTIREQ